jgi:hypothetical protein
MRRLGTRASHLPQLIGKAGRLDNDDATITSTDHGTVSAHRIVGLWRAHTRAEPTMQARQLPKLEAGIRLTLFLKGFGQCTENQANLVMPQADPIVRGG